MRGICELLDEGNARRPYTAALELQEAKIRDVALTPSARTLQELRNTGESFAQMALRMSNLHKNYFLDLYPPNEQRLAAFALTLLRPNGQLGPDITRSTLDCAAIARAGREGGASPCPARPH